jgi:hypothetical protein
MIDQTFFLPLQRYEFNFCNLVYEWANPFEKIFYYYTVHCRNVHGTKLLHVQVLKTRHAYQRVMSSLAFLAYIFLVKLKVL